MNVSYELVKLLKLSIQNALLGNVTSNIRSIVVNIVDKNIRLFFYYDGDISVEDKENASLISSEVISNFEEGFDINEDLIRLDYPFPIKNSDGFCVYFRKES